MDENIRLTDFEGHMRAEIERTLQAFNKVRTDARFTDEAMVHIANHVGRVAESACQLWREEGDESYIGVGHVKSALRRDQSTTGKFLGHETGRAQGSKLKPVQVADSLALREQILGNAAVLFSQHSKLDLLVKSSADKIIAFIVYRSQEGTDPQLLMESRPTNCDLAALRSLDAFVKLKVAFRFP